MRSMILPALVALSMASASAVHAATFTVNSAADLVDLAPGDGACDAGGGQCTLRAAVMEANILPGPDTIVFDAALDGTPITLTRPCSPIGCFIDGGSDGDLNVFDDLVITGNGPANTIIEAGTSLVTAVDRVIYAGASLSLSGVTIQNGWSRDSGQGGGIVSNSPLTLTDCVIRNNQALTAFGFGAGGGIYSQSELVLSRVSVSGNRAASGAGVYWSNSEQLLSITETTIDDNHADSGEGRGGGLLTDLFGPDPPVIVISNSTISGNTASVGCALYHANAPLRLHSVTLAGNCAPGSGTAAVVASYGDGNGNDGGQVLFSNTILAGVAGTDNCRVESIFGVPPGFASEGYNLSSDATCGLALAGDVQGTSPLLGPLAGNGGPTRTHLPLAGSPAVDTGTPVSCLTYDQRGLARPADGGSGLAVCDKGAVEIASAAPPPPPTAGTIQGAVWNDDGDGIRQGGEPGYPGIQVCLFPTSPTLCLTTLADGTYRFLNVEPGSHHVYVRVPADRLSTTPRARQVDVVAGALVTGVDFGLRVPPPPPPLPVPWDAPQVAQGWSGTGKFFVLRVTPPCAASAVTLTLYYVGLTQTIPMLNAGGNVWLVSVPSSEPGSILPYHVEASCSPFGYTGFIVFIDPSGTILDACTGQPLAGATVTLLKNDPYGSSSYAVPDPGEHIPAQNPEVTAADGLYGWDVVPGNWRVRASKPGYDTVTSDPFDVPPPKLDLDLTLLPTAGCGIAPVAGDDAYTTGPAGLTVAPPGVLGNDTDANGDSLTAVLVTGAAHGTAALQADGSFTYTPSPGFSGTDAFTYRARDGSRESNLAKVTITVKKAGGSAPVARDDSYRTRENRVLVVDRPGVLANDKDPDRSKLTARLVRAPSRGFVVLSPSGGFAYLPKPGFVGKDSFTYKASDGTQSSNTATVVIEVDRKHGHGGHDDDDDDDHDCDRHRGYDRR